MKYTYHCPDCGCGFVVDRPVHFRDDLAPCACGGKSAHRNVAADLRSSRIITWKYWCGSTSADHMPTRDEQAAAEKSWENFEMPEKAPNPIAELKDKVRHGAV